MRRLIKDGGRPDAFLALAKPEGASAMSEPTYRIKMTAEQIGRDGANPARTYEKGEEVSVGEDLRRVFVEELRVAVNATPGEYDSPAPGTLFAAKTEGVDRHTKTEGEDRKKK